MWLLQHQLWHANSVIEQRQCSCQQGGLIVVSARYGVLDAMLQAERRERQGLQAAGTSAPAAAVQLQQSLVSDTQPDRRDAGTTASTSGVARAARDLAIGVFWLRCFVANSSMTCGFNCRGSGSMRQVCVVY